MQLFNLCNRPFGLAFHHIIHYPQVAGNVEQKRILMPGQSEAKKDEDLSDEQILKMSETFIRDLYYWNRSIRYRSQLANEFVQSVRNAAFGETDKPEMKMALQGAVFCFLFTGDWLPFFLRVYQTSGQQADQFNVDEDKTKIIEMKSAPDNPRLYRQYADRLWERQEYNGALNAYMRLKEIQPEVDDEVEARMEELKKTVMGENM
jgi:hypothetical protein